MSPLTRTRSLLAATAAAALLALPAAAAARDTTVRSFDGTSLVVHFFPAAHLKHGARVPTVLVGPGWSAPGSTNENGATSTGGGAVGIGPLRRAGYNVLTWDPRGFGRSGGTAEVDSPKFEGRDVSALIDYVARQPEAQLDGRQRPPRGHGGRLVRRRHPAGGGRDRPSHRRDRAGHRLELAADEPRQERHGQVRLGARALRGLRGGGRAARPRDRDERDAGGRLVPPGRRQPRLLHLARAGQTWSPASRRPRC